MPRPRGRPRKYPKIEEKTSTNAATMLLPVCTNSHREYLVHELYEVWHFNIIADYELIGKGAFTVRFIGLCRTQFRNTWSYGITHLYGNMQMRMSRLEEIKQVGIKDAISRAKKLDASKDYASIIALAYTIL